MQSNKKITVDDLHEINNRLLAGMAEKVVDIESLILSAKGDLSLQRCSAIFIPRFFKKFPNHINQSLESMRYLIKNSEKETKILAINGLKDFFSERPEETFEIALKAYDETDENVISVLNRFMTSHISKPSETQQKKLLEIIISLPTKAQDSLISLIIEYLPVQDEYIPFVVDIVKIALNSNLELFMKLFMKFKRFLSSEHKNVIADQLLTHLEKGLSESFVSICQTVLIGIFDIIFQFGEEISHRFMSIISRLVMPQVSLLNDSIIVVLLQKTEENCKYVTDPTLISVIYNKFFMTLPKFGDSKFKYNMSIIEASLFLIYKLGKMFPRELSSLIGVLLVITGQPDEYEGIEPDSALKEEFEIRLQALSSILDSFIQKYTARLETYMKEYIPDSKEELMKIRKECKIAIKTGNNCKHFCRIFQEPNILQSKPPSDVSWRPPKQNPKQNSPNRYNNYHGKRNHRW